MKVSPEIASLVPYSPGKPIEETRREFGLDSIVKLASNENALGPSPKALQAIQDALHDLHRYPDAASYELTEALSRHYEVDPSWIVFGNGSNELIDLLIRIYCEPGDRILLSEKSFIAYKICAQAARVGINELKMTPDCRMDLRATAQFIEANPGQDRLIFIPNPNNPTGTYVNRQDVEALLKVAGNRDDVLVVFDEAYNEFVRAEDYPQALDYVREYSNVVVMRTLSKVYGLAGLRIGALVARPDVTGLVHRVRNPFNVNSLAQAAAVAALGDSEYLRHSQAVVWTGLDFFYSELQRLGLPFLPSQANFVLFDTLRDAQTVSDALLKKGVILRPLKGYDLPRHLRMSVGLAEENLRAIKALSEVLAGIPQLKGSA